MKNNDIVIIPAWYPTARDPVAGIFIQQQARALKEAGININIFFVEEEWSPWAPRVGKVKYVLEEGLPTYRIRAVVPPKRIKLLRGYWLNQWRRLMEAYIKQNNCRPRLLHAHSFVGGAAARSLSRSFDIPYIITEHHGGVSTREISPCWQKELPGIYQTAEKVLAVSASLQKTIAAFGADVETLANIIDTNLFFPNPEKQSSAIFRIINVGGFDPEKDSSPLIKAVAKLEFLDNITLYLVGDGPLRPKLKRLVKRLDLEKQVCFVGKKNPKELANLMQNSDLYVSTSRLESFGMALAEAMACGLPVVSPKEGIAGEIIDGKNGRLVSNELEMLAAISYFKDHLHSLDPLPAYHLIHERFGREPIIGKLKQLYEIIMNGPC